MQLGLYLAFDPPQFAASARSDSLLLDALPMLEELAQEWGVRPLSHYLDQRSDSAQPRSDWYALEAGLQTVMTLLHSPVCEEPALQAELSLWQRQLEFAGAQGAVGFRIEVEPVSAAAPSVLD